jgi:DNA polymerase-1
MKLLIDSDMLLIRACEAASSEVRLDDDIWVKWTDERQAAGNYWEYVSVLSEVSSVSVEDAVHCFTARSQFRRDLFPGYKASRKGVKPMGYNAILQGILSSENYAFQYNEIEADDLIGIFADKFREEGCVIASGDKDLKQIPGHHVWLDKELHFISDNDAQRFFYGQVLMGDSTDGVPGCAGIGPKTAAPIISKLDLSDPVGCWEAIVSVYRAKGKVDRPDEFALLQARLVHILRDGEYDFSSHQVKLWTPPIATIP